MTTMKITVEYEFSERKLLYLQELYEEENAEELDEEPLDFEDFIEIVKTGQVDEELLEYCATDMVESDYKIEFLEK